LKSHPLLLYSAYLDGYCLSDAEVAELRAWIDADPRNIDEFVQFASVHAAITDRLILSRLLDDLAWRREPAIVTPEALAEALREIETVSPSALRPLMPVEPPLPHRTLLQTLAPFAAAIALVGFVGWATWKWAEPVAIAVVEREVAPAPAPLPPPPVLAGRVRNSFDAQWAGDESVRLGGELFEGSTLELLGGVVQLEMANGTVVVVEGPSRFEMTAPDAIHLAEGKAAVRIEGAAESFVVNTPTMQVIDLGTEFGVQAGPAGESLVSVFDGRVEVAGQVEGRPGDRGESQGREGRLLEAGFEVSIDSEPRQARFRTVSWPITSPVGGLKGYWPIKGSTPRRPAWTTRWGLTGRASWPWARQHSSSPPAGQRADSMFRAGRHS
jgi:ferric-dicitrate binding protein FerR (iron transport regulator)